jgi:hypothetical protein
LKTGVTAAHTGIPYGKVGRFYFDTWLPGERVVGKMLFEPSDMGAFYVWASLIEAGRVVATDYAPDVGWLDPR